MANITDIELMDEWQHLKCRVDAHPAYKRLSKTTDIGGDGLANLLGYENYNELMAKFDDGTMRVCEALCSSHGYAVYKILLARRKHG